MKNTVSEKPYHSEVGNERTDLHLLGCISQVNICNGSTGSTTGTLILRKFDWAAFSIFQSIF
jgi:hypothetical protein